MTKSHVSSDVYVTGCRPRGIWIHIELRPRTIDKREMWFLGFRSWSISLQCDWNWYFVYNRPRFACCHCILHPEWQIRAIQMHKYLFWKTGIKTSSEVLFKPVPSQINLVWQHYLRTIFFTLSSSKQMKHFVIKEIVRGYWLFDADISWGGIHSTQFSKFCILRRLRWRKCYISLPVCP